MSDHIEHKCSRCGSLLHHTEDCPSKLMSDTPRTDAEILHYTGGEPVTFRRGINYTVDYQFAQFLERENNQLRADLKQCAKAIDVIFSDDDVEDKDLNGDDVEDKDLNGDIIGYSFQTHSELCRMLKRALSLPSVQASLKSE